MSEEDLVLLEAGPITEAGTVEESVFKARRIEDQMHGQNTTKENEEVDIERRHEVQHLYGKRFVYYTISHAFIDILGIIVSYSFPQTLCT